MQYETNTPPTPRAARGQTWHCTITAEAVVHVDALSQLAAATTGLEARLSGLALEGTTDVWVHHSSQPVPTPQQAYKLNDREAEVTRLVAQGLTNKQIGDNLGLAEATIKDYVSRCQEKMNANNRAEVAALYVGALARVSGMRGLLEEGFITSNDNVR